MTRYRSLFRRLLSRENKGEEAEEEEGSVHRESSQQGESSACVLSLITVGDQSCWKMMWWFNFSALTVGDCR